MAKAAIAIVLTLVCVGKDGTHRMDVVVGKDRVTIRSVSRAPENHPTIGRKVEGVGVKARTTTTFSDGSFSYFDEYGNVREPELILKGKVMSWGLRCVSQVPAVANP